MTTLVTCALITISVFCVGFVCGAAWCGFFTKCKVQEEEYAREWKRREGGPIDDTDPGRDI